MVELQRSVTFTWLAKRPFSGKGEGVYLILNFARGSRPAALYANSAHGVRRRFIARGCTAPWQRTGVGYILIIKSQSATKLSGWADSFAARLTERQEKTFSV